MKPDDILQAVSLLEAKDRLENLRTVARGMTGAVCLPAEAQS